MESQSADAEPPPPPKPELRYPGLPRADTEGETHTNIRTCTYLQVIWHVNIWVLSSGAAQASEVFSLLCKQTECLFFWSHAFFIFHFWFLANQRAVCWLTLHQHRRCTSTDRPSTAQEGTTLPSHIPTRYMSVYTCTILKVLGIDC